MTKSRDSEAQGVQGLISILETTVDSFLKLGNNNRAFYDFNSTKSIRSSSRRPPILSRLPHWHINVVMIAFVIAFMGNITS